MTERHNVLIIGGGPAGLFCAHELARYGVEDIVLIDAGKEAAARSCPLTTSCNCTPCDILEGLGGSGGVSDGKMTFSLDRGTQLEPVFRDQHESLLGYVDQIMQDLEVEGVRYDPSQATAEQLSYIARFDSSPIDFGTYPLWHIGSDGVKAFSQRFTDRVRQRGVLIHRGVRALKLLSSGPRVFGARIKDRKSRKEREIHANHVVVAGGIYGMGWVEEQLTLMGFQFSTGPAGIGFRIETPQKVLAPLFDAFYDWKLVGEYHGIVLRSFCCNRNGHIMPEYHKHLNIRNVNGHSYLDPDLRSDSSNFSLQAKIPTSLHPDPQAYVRTVAREMNRLSGGWQVRQSVEDFLAVRDPNLDYERSPDYLTYPQARPRNVAQAVPGGLREAFIDYIEELDRLVPGIVSSGWVYGPEVKYHARKLPIDRETWALKGMEGISVIGDSTGLTGSYVSAALTGIIAAQGIEQTTRRPAYATD